MSIAELPIVCQLDLKHGMFCVVRAKGKALSSGGYGVAITAEKVNDFLYIEEVLFLFERGTLNALSENMESLNSSQLYRLLPHFGISLPLYLVYSHLRSQDFRVLRHNPNRINILKRQQQVEPTNSQLLKRSLKRKVRDTIREAPFPQIPEKGICLCFDVYRPNTAFSKLDPGLPDFYVASSFYNDARVTFDNCKSILESCKGIPLKLATVSDSGTVVMFGITDLGIPSIT